MADSPRAAARTLALLLTCGGLALAALPVRGDAESAEAPLPAVSAHPPVSAFAGEFRWVEDAEEAGGIERAIEGVVSGVNFLVRGLARSRLSDANGVKTDLEIGVDEGGVMIAFGEGRLAAPIDGAPIERTNPHGEPVTIRHRLEGRSLVQTIEGEQGGQTRVFRLLPDGEHIELEMRTDMRVLRMDRSKRNVLLKQW